MPRSTEESWTAFNHNFCNSFRPLRPNRSLQNILASLEILKRPKMFLTYVWVRYWDKESHLNAGFNESSNKISSNLFNLEDFSSLSVLEGWFIMWSGNLWNMGNIHTRKQADHQCNSRSLTHKRDTKGIFELLQNWGSDAEMWSPIFNV